MSLSKWSLPLIFLLGMGFGFAHAPFHLPLLAIWALPVAVILARKTERKLWAGYLFGLGFFALTMSWISEPFAVGPPDYAWMALPAWILMAGGLSLFWIPLFAFLRRGVWTVALMFGIMEYMRGHIFSGLPWALLAYGWQDSVVAQNAAWLGAYGLSAVLALAAVLALNWREMRDVILGFALFVALGVFGYFRAEPSDLTLADIKARAVQPNFSVDDRFTIAPEEQLKTLVELSRSDADLVVWPEGSTFISPTFYPQLLQDLNTALPNKTLIFGAPHYENELYYNSAFTLRPDGAFTIYEKQHLVPFGEYIPFGDWLLERGIATKTITTFNARKGRPAPYPDWAGPRANIIICYEGIFPKMARREGDYLVQITNDVWFGTRSGPYQHLAAARFRAIENGQPLVRSALTGVSAIINAKGEILESLDVGKRGAVQAPLGAKYENTIYRQIGDWPFLIISILAFVYVVASGRVKR